MYFISRIVRQVLAGELFYFKQKENNLLKKIFLGQKFQKFVSLKFIFYEVLFS